MASERTAAAVPEESSVSDGRSSVAGATRSAVRSAVSAIDSLRDRLVNATDPVPDLASDPADDAHLDGTGSDTRGLVLRPALLGFVAILAVAIGASLPSSPFKLEMPGVWFFGEPSTSSASRSTAGSYCSCGCGGGCSGSTAAIRASRSRR